MTTFTVIKLFHVLGGALFFGAAASMAALNVLARRAADTEHGRAYWTANLELARKPVVHGE